jgi:hypothetical protein
LSRSWRTPFRSTSATTLLLCLLAIDLLFGILHFLLLTDWLSSASFSLESDRGYPESYQYMKILLAVGLLAAVFRKTRMPGFAVWSLLFFYLLIDDAFSIHETLGAHAAAAFGYMPALGLRAQDFGELTVSATSAALFLLPLAYFYSRGTEPDRAASRHLLLLLLSLAFFGIFVDMLHVAIDAGWKIQFLLGAVEDGGEMVTMSIMAWYAFLLHENDGNIRRYFPGATSAAQEQAA